MRTPAKEEEMGDGGARAEPRPSVTGSTGTPLAVVGLGPEGLNIQVYPPCRFSSKTLSHFYMRSYADLMVFGAIIGFLVILILTEIWSPVSERYVWNSPVRGLS